MKMYQEKKNWIWESENFPHFVYSEVVLDRLYYKFGQLKMLEEILNRENYSELMLNVLVDEAISTLAIEGEVLQRSSVRSSINKLLKLGLEDDHSYSRESDALIEVILDAKTNAAPLTKERLFAWHRALFINGSGLREINIGKYRTDSEAMQIVSGAWNREKIHYVAPPSHDMKELMERFLSWLNREDEISAIYKAVIAHLYFVLIHPFDDGNGRIARAITDYILSKADLANGNFYSISTMIYKNRKAYYAVLDSLCVNVDQDINAWIEWFVDLLEDSIDDTLARVAVVKTKAKFWDRHKETKLNERQKKAIFKMLSVLPEKFEGGMRVQKYMSLTKTTRITASRDLNNLLEKGVMQRFGSGRGVYYELDLGDHQ
jgi:Fic family protein